MTFLGILKRLGQLLGTNREAALEVLEAIRSEYPKELQYQRVTKFLLDQTTTPSVGFLNFPLYVKFLSRIAKKQRFCAFCAIWHRD